MTPIRESINFSPEVQLGLLMKDADIRDQAISELLPWIERVARIMAFGVTSSPHNIGRIQRLDDIIQVMRLAACEKIDAVINGNVEIQSSVEGYLNVSLVGIARNFIRRDHLIPVDLKVNERVPLQRITEDFDVEAPLIQNENITDIYDELQCSESERQIIDMMQIGHNIAHIAVMMRSTEIIIHQMLDTLRERIHGVAKKMMITNKQSRAFYKKMTVQAIERYVELHGDDLQFAVYKCDGYNIKDIARMTNRSPKGIVASLRKTIATYLGRRRVTPEENSQ